MPTRCFSVARPLSPALQACVFENSKRARALFYRVLELSRAPYRGEFKDPAKAMTETFDNMDSLSLRPAGAEYCQRPDVSGCRAEGHRNAMTALRRVAMPRF